MNATFRTSGFLAGAVLLLAAAVPSNAGETMTSANYEASRPTLSSGGASGGSLSTGSLSSTLGEAPAIGFSAEFVTGNSNHAGFWPATRIDTDLDGILDENDNCPYAANADQEDTGGVASPADPSGLIADGIGDACQCGDVNDDGRVTGIDGTLINRWAVGLPPGMTAPEKCIVIGTTCNGVDNTIIQRTVLDLPPGIQQLCDPALP